MNDVIINECQEACDNSQHIYIIYIYICKNMYIYNPSNGWVYTMDENIILEKCEKQWNKRKTKYELWKFDI